MHHTSLHMNCPIHFAFFFKSDFHMNCPIHFSSFVLLVRGLPVGFLERHVQDAYLLSTTFCVRWGQLSICFIVSWNRIVLQRLDWQYRCHILWSRAQHQNPTFVIKAVDHISGMMFSFVITTGLFLTTMPSELISTTS